MELARFRRQQHLSAQHYLDKATHDTAISESVKLIAKQFRVPMVRVNILDADRQVTIAAFGAPLTAILRANSLCTHVVSDGHIKTLADIHPIPAGAAHIKAYVGVPLTGREGLVIGTLCLLDTVPRKFNAEDLENLQAAAAVIQDQLELIRRLTGVNNATTTEAIDLMIAIEERQIVPYYQPIVDLHTGKTVGIEALARWEHPQFGLLASDAFIPMAEDSDIIIDLDLAILGQAAAELGRWRTEQPTLRLNVNLSARHFDDPECVRRLEDTVTRAGVPPTAITFELTESAAMAVDPAAREFLSRLRQAGFTVVLDDFGTGFASIDQMLRLPIDGVKINRTLTAALHTHLGETIVRHLVSLANDLSLTTVIEGIETLEQNIRARDAGATCGQGYLWASALTAGDLTAHLTGAGSMAGLLQ